MQPPTTPQADKLATRGDEARAIYEFLEWLSDQEHISLCIQHEHSPKPEDDGSDEHKEEGCWRWQRDHWSQELAWEPECGYHDGDLVPAYRPRERLVNDYLGVDTDVLEKERRKIIEYAASLNA